ncbi:MAG TPA: class I SAM-dependent methyltransferase [Thermoplasmata archaeon]|nr:class I SAM-dependent methyltransferase [Thermoplasmata archaeon]
MRAPRKSSGSSLRVRFSADRPSEAHSGWYAAFAARYDDLYRSPERVRFAAPFLDGILRRHAPGIDVLDVACGTFSMDVPLLARGYHIVGRDLSPAMVAHARRALRSSRRRADVRRADMRTLDLGRTFDAVLCLGTAFNYLVEPTEIRATVGVFKKHLHPRGILILDLTNFEAWIRNPMNARAEVDETFPDGVRVTVFGLNDQDLRRRIHSARFITAVKRGRRLDLRFSEAPLRIWRKEDLGGLLRRSGFSILGWWGDLRIGRSYDPRTRSRLDAVAVRR